MWATAYSRADTAHFLLERGANINDRNNVLFLCFSQNHCLQISRFSLSVFPSLNVVCLICMMNQCIVFLMKICYCAVLCCVVLCCIWYKLGNTALMLAVEEGDKDLVEVLLTSGADCEIKNNAVSD